MKKYIVIREFTVMNPTVVFSSDNKDDAEQYARIMQRNDGYMYAVAEVTFRIGG